MLGNLIGIMLQHIEIQRQYPGKIKLVQMTDTHISSVENDTLAGVDTTGTLVGVIAAVKREEHPDLVLLTGDLAQTPTEDTYNKLAGLLRRIELPVYCLPGNHDDPALMQRLLNTGNVSTANFITCGNWSIILLDTHEPGKEGGCLSVTELEGLAEALERSTGRHVLICLHHQPVNIHSPWMDRMALENGEALFQVLDRYTNVRGIIWGHIHQEFTTTRNGVLLLGSPSTCIQFRPQADEASVDGKPPAYRTLTLVEDGDIQTRVHWV